MTDPGRSIGSLPQTPSALEIELLELVVQRRDVGELIDRVAVILDVPIILFDTRGQVVCCSGSAADTPDLAARMWAAYEGVRGASDPDGVAIGAGERAYVHEILVRDRAERVLGAIIAQSPPPTFSGATFQLLRQLVTLDLLCSRDELRMRRRVRRGLLRDVLAGNGTFDKLRIRLQAQGFDEGCVMRIVIVEPEPPRTPLGQSPGTRTTGRLGGRLLRNLDEVLSQRRMPFLSSSLGSLSVVLTELPDDGTTTARALLEDLHEAALQAASPSRVAVACSAPLAGLASAARGLQQARAACIAARRAPRDEPKHGLR